MASHPQIQNIKLPPTHAVAAKHNISIVNVKYQLHFTSCKYLFCQLKMFVSLLKQAVYSDMVKFCNDLLILGSNHRCVFHVPKCHIATHASNFVHRILLQPEM
jgi:hypothetical protein